MIKLICDKCGGEQFRYEHICYHAEGSDYGQSRRVDYYEYTCGKCGWQASLKEKI